MEDLKAADVMMRPVVSAKSHASARDVALQLLTGLYSGMPVTDNEGKVIGVITEIDLLMAVMAGKELVRITAGDVMTKDPISADVDTSISDIVKIMTEKHLIRLPITENGILVGIVARCDVLKSLIEPEFVTYM
jgi:CBS domain-containing protein